MNQLTKDKTMVEQNEFNEKKKASAQAYQDRKKEAAKLINFFLETEEGKNINPETRTAIQYLAGSGVRSARAGVASELKMALLAGPMSLKDIFKKFEYGRPTMEAKIKSFLKVKDTTDRIWVSFHDGVYEVMGQGTNAPDGWTGFIPPEVTEKVAL